MSGLRTILAALCLLSPTLAAGQDGDQATGNFAFINGQWFDGQSFKPDHWYSVNGRLTRTRPDTLDGTFDLENRYVVPPFGDAHTHNLDRSSHIPEIERNYLREGTFYAQVLTNYASGAKALRPYYARPDTMDVSFANGGWTATRGHPYLYYEPKELGFPAILWRERYDELWDSRLAMNDAYYFADTPDDVDRLWPQFLATEPDFVKTFFRDIKSHREIQRGDALNSIGVSEPVATRIAELAREEGLRLYIHVETADDFEVALGLGVDTFGHLPGFLWNGSLEDMPAIELDDDLIRAAGQAEVVVIPTISISEFYAVRIDPMTGEKRPHAEWRERQQAYLHRTVRALIDAGATIALGSDHATWTMTQVIEYHRDAGLFTPIELLEILSVVTPQTIFPDRNLGVLAEGRVANFLVLGSDPTTSADALLNVEMRIKEGSVLDIPQKSE